METSMRRRASALAIVACACVFAMAAVTNADQIYTGSLTYTPPLPANAADGLFVGGPAGQWDAMTLTFSWVVTNSDDSHPGFPWKYEYRLLLSGSDHAYSHLNIEVSDGFGDNDIIGLIGANVDCIGTQQANNANQGMPESLYAIKFNPPDGVTDWTFSFFSNRMPVWGDFYVRNGGHQGVINHAYNYNMDDNGVESGFLSPDVDPTDAPSAGTADNHYFYHILRPDTATTPIPEPATLALLGTGLLTFIGVVRRRRMR